VRCREVTGVEPGPRTLPYFATAAKGIPVANAGKPGDDADTDTAPIDVVVSWVDGNDPVHAAKRHAARAGAQLTATAIPGGKAATRFADSGELALCLGAIRRHCPWVRTIHLVTDAQVPAFLTAPEQVRLGVRIVDHTHLFRGHEWALPTFNSRTIETALHRIDGLSERFVYFNDDVIVLRPTPPEEFFAANGPVLRGEWRPLPRFGRLRTLLSSIANHVAAWRGVVRSTAVLAKYRAAQAAGFRDRYLDAPHVPHPLRRATLGGFFDAHPDLFAKNIRYRFRDMDQFVPCPLANHLEIAAGTWVHSPAHDYLLVCFNRDTPETIEAGIAALEAGGCRFLCLQGFERATPAQRARVLAALA
jgi:hypothetical protein